MEILHRPKTMSTDEVNNMANMLRDYWLRISADSEELYARHLMLGHELDERYDATLDAWDALYGAYQALRKLTNLV